MTEGSVGGGVGTGSFGWKGGIGTASRVVPPEADGFVVGALVQSNFGRPRDLVICGVPVGRYLQPPGDGATPGQDRGSIMIVLATDAPLDARQLGRLCVWAAVGVVRTGGLHGHASGDFVIGFSVANRLTHAPEVLTRVETVVADEARAMQWLFPAVAESVEEAILNSLCRATTVVGRDGNIRHALPVEEVAHLVHGRLASRPICG